MIQKERVKNKIKQTKLNERNGTFASMQASGEYGLLFPPFSTLIFA